MTEQSQGNHPDSPAYEDVPWGEIAAHEASAAPVERPRRRGPVRRGDNIPTVADYSHWNEEAEAMWYAENRYDMEHADEILDEDDGDWYEGDYDE